MGNAERLEFVADDRFQLPGREENIQYGFVFFTAKPTGLCGFLQFHVANICTYI
jgi:hypothetical protein